MSGLRIVALVALALAASSAQAADGCTFKGPRLYCLDGPRTLEAIVARFASDQTRRLLEAESRDFSRFDGRPDRERYRVSVERNNRRAIRYAKRADRLVRRNRIEAAEYDRRMAIYRDAYRNYRVAIDRYQASYWFDPVQDASDGVDRDDTIAVKG